MAVFHVHEAILIFSSIATTSGMVTVLRGTNWLNFFMVILYDLTSFFRGQTSELNGWNPPLLYPLES